jgi:hypothetical protein
MIPFQSRERTCKLDTFVAGREPVYLAGIWYLGPLRAVSPLLARNGHGYIVLAE